MPSYFHFHWRKIIVISIRFEICFKRALKFKLKNALLKNLAVYPSVSFLLVLKIWNLCQLCCIFVVRHFPWVFCLCYCHVFGLHGSSTRFTICRKYFRGMTKNGRRGHVWELQLEDACFTICQKVHMPCQIFQRFIIYS